MRVFVGVPWRWGLKRQYGGQNPAIFSNFGRHIYGVVRVEANIIMQRYEVPYRLSSVLKLLNFE